MTEEVKPAPVPETPKPQRERKALQVRKGGTKEVK